MLCTSSSVVLGFNFGTVPKLVKPRKEYNEQKKKKTRGLIQTKQESDIEFMKNFTILYRV